MEIKQKDLDKEWSGSPAIFTKNGRNVLHAVNCRPKARECESARSSLTQIAWIATDEKLRGIETPG